MTKSNFARSLAAISVAILLASSMAPAEAQRHAGGGGGGHAAARGGGGGGHAGGGAAARPQVNNTRADSRSRDVRNTSVNNVNANRNVNVNSNRNVNVNVDNNHGGCCGWDNDYHPVATAAAVTATVAVTSAVIGSMTRTVPAGCVPINYGGMVYQQCGATWYVPQNGQYMVVAPPY
ncbi:MAG: hypothetical protein JSS14_04825 [Proteobacteria bacterium]|nr:hypothetical protein [Pseudomonadota bacterium]